MSAEYTTDVAVFARDVMALGNVIRFRYEPFERVVRSARKRTRMSAIIGRC